MLEIKVEWDVYNFKTWCVIGPYSRLAAYVKKRHRRIFRRAKDDATVGLYFRNVGNKGGIIWLAEPPTTPKRMGYMVHEITHAAVDMLSDRGVYISGDNDESLCYAVAHGVQRILEGLKALDE